jgi:hypothetical protein
LEWLLFDGDALTALDARISLLRARRSAAPRYSDAYWAAVDALAFLRMLRDEVRRTGRLRDELVALLELPPTSVPIEPDPVDPLAEVVAIGVEPDDLDEAPLAVIGPELLPTPAGAGERPRSDQATELGAA